MVMVMVMVMVVMMIVMVMVMVMSMVIVVVVFYYCDMGEDCYNCYILKTGSQLTPRAIVGL